MKYKITNNEIIITKNSDFDAKSILECGQLFRFYKTENGYVVISGNKLAQIIETENNVIIKTQNPKYFEKYFDLKTNYSKIKDELKQYPILAKAIEYGKGIRIVKGEPEEIILQFIISQNNNIKRIQKIVEKMSELGESIDEKHKAFPSSTVLAKMPLEYFKSLGAGYRDKYLKSTSEVLAKTDLKEIEKLSDEDLYDWLISLNGVGPKVASCIMLFGFGRTSSFPVDTWIEKVYRTYFYEGEKTRLQISKFLQNKFGIMSGIVQQYLFFYARENGN